MRSLKQRGFNLRTWERAGMVYWAVSGLNAQELDEFVRLFRESTAPPRAVNRARLELGWLPRAQSVMLEAFPRERAMTEAEWLGCTHPRVMLRWLGDRSPERKRRLFACACCHRVRRLMSDDGSWNAVLAAERYADGSATAEELTEAADVANGNMLGADNRIQRRADEAAYRSAVILADELFLLDLTWASAALALEGHALETSSGLSAEDTEEMLSSWAEAWGGSGEPMGWTDPDPAAEMVNLLRDIFGNPFRPMPFSPSWRTSTVVALAAQMYESRDFSAMPILADALQDAGCEIAEVLDHCRNDGPHVRGCWVVDLVLGKE